MSVMGMGGKPLKMLALLVDIKIYIRGRTVNPEGVVGTIFRVLEGPGYHIILCRRLLTQIYKLLDISGHKLSYKIAEIQHAITTILDSAVILKLV